MATLLVVGGVSPAAAVTSNPTYTVSGHVDLGGIGTSAPAGSVVMRAWTFALTGSGSNPLHDVATVDENGNYSFEVGHDTGVILEAHSVSDLYQDRWWPSQPFQQSASTIQVTSASIGDASFVVPLAASIHGHVDLGDSTRSAKSNEVKVSLLERSFTGPGWAVTATATTDSAGDYTIGHLSSDSYRLVAKYTGPDSFAPYTPSGPQASDGGDFVLTTLPAEHNITMAAGATIQGTVTTTSGLPLSEAEVLLSAGNPLVQVASTSTKPDGTYAFVDLPAAEYVVEFYHQSDVNSAPRNGRYFWRDRSTAPNLAQPIPLIAGEDHPTDFAFPNASTLAGSIGCATCASASKFSSFFATLDQRDPVTNEWVTLITSNVDWVKGTYVFRDLTPATYRVRIVHADGGTDYTERISPSYVVAETSAQVEPTLTVSRGGLLIRTSSGALKRYYTKSGGKLGAATTISSNVASYPTIVRPGDLDNNGVADLLLRDKKGGVWLWTGTSSDKVAHKKRIATGWKSYTALFSGGDYNGDGIPDVFARKPTGELVLYSGTGGATFSPTTSTTASTEWKGYNLLVGVPDVDGDGNADVLARTKAGELWLYPGDGVGGLKPSVLVGSGYQAYKTLVTFNVVSFLDDTQPDSHPDLAGSTSSGNVYLLKGQGDGSFVKSTRIAKGWSKLSLLPSN